MPCRCVIHGFAPQLRREQFKPMNISAELRAQMAAEDEQMIAARIGVHVGGGEREVKAKAKSKL